MGRDLHRSLEEKLSVNAVEARACKFSRWLRLKMCRRDFTA